MDSEDHDMLDRLAKHLETLDLRDATTVTMDGQQAAQLAYVIRETLATDAIGAGEVAPMVAPSGAGNRDVKSIIVEGTISATPWICIGMLAGGILAGA